MCKDCYVFFLYPTEKRKTVGIRMVFIKMSLKITERPDNFQSISFA